ncbi:MAG: hypothetical protein U1E18_01820 [Brevundimonas sp.]|uniref:hypothetical protein n=1 Tax=Brevundimonas sp. TaxID=1871086 RepID=UPI002AB995BD|nr:hypothetical protein [Brevundimonas sp.]MDZ4108321.1 hypothetical protein [Brevundimonas sp.]
MIELFAALIQDPPPPIIEYRQPNSGAIEATWDCRGRQVRYRIETEWDRVRLVSYSGAAGPASDADLAKINEGLAPIWAIGGLTFLCTADADNLGITGPRKGGGGDAWISARWYNGQLHLRTH